MARDDEIDDLTLPDGWAWTVNPHDLSRGVVVHKLWWRNGKPHMRARVILLEQNGQARCYCNAELAVRKIKLAFGPKESGGKRVIGGKHCMEWTHSVCEPDLPLDPLAAAGYIELVAPELEQRLADLYAAPLWSDHDG